MGSSLRWNVGVFAFALNVFRDSAGMWSFQVVGSARKHYRSLIPRKSSRESRGRSLILRSGSESPPENKHLVHVVLRHT